MDLMNLGFGDDGGLSPSDAQPTSREVPASGDLPPWETEFTAEDAPSFDDGASASEEETELEIYKKAARFNALNLLSGNSFSQDELRNYVSEHYGTRGLQRLKMAEFVMGSLKYNRSPDVLLMLSCTNRAKIVVATAGAGKTTSLQFDIVISKLLDKALGENNLLPERIADTSVHVSRVLYLNYNKHNVQPIRDRHSSVVRAINGLLRDGEGIDDSIDSTTVHAFCHRWLTAFATEIALPPLTIITEEQKERVWVAIIEPRWKKFYGNEAANMVEYTVLDELYNFKTESMQDWDEFFESAKFCDSGLKSEFVQSCIKKYDSMKKQMQLIDFTDYLIMLTNILREHDDLRKKLQSRYRIIIADENQDFTRLMNELLLQLYDPDINQLIVVGDPDQTIYAFKGVSPDNVVTLAESLPDVQVLGLDTNYRCPDRVVEAAKAILDRNILRFDKPINTVRTGGLLRAHPCDPSSSQDSKVMDLLKRIGAGGWSNTVVTYRNNISSLIIAEEMYYANIPFTILDSRRPFSNPVFRQVTRALSALQEKDNLELNHELFRFLPMTKEQWSKILNYNRERRHNHLHDLEIPANVPNGTMQALQTLVQISEQIDTQPTCDYIDALARLYRKYHLDFIIQHGGPIVPEVDNYLLYFDRMMKFYHRHMTFALMMAERDERNRDNPAGVTLSTFHGLKGLEFDYVIAVDFNEAIFPNYSNIEQRYSANTAAEEKESENRLCYVLVTRAIKELHFFYEATDPSVYVGILMPAGSSDTVKEAEDELTLGSVSGTFSGNAKTAFINNILNGRG